jgi:hypothetical protein
VLSRTGCLVALDHEHIVLLQSISFEDIYRRDAHDCLRSSIGPVGAKA